MTIGPLEGLASLSNDFGVGDQVRQFFAEQAEAQSLSTELQATLGLAAYQRRDYQAARDHFEQVLRQDPTFAGVANNLAWLLSQTDPVDLERALTMANRAVEADPSNAIFRETRGQILVQLQQWEQAVSDLEFALNGSPDPHEIHLALASAYERLSQPALAQAHRQAAAVAP